MDFVYKSRYVGLTTHGFMHICTVFAFVFPEGKQSHAGARPFTDSLRGQNRFSCEVFWET